MQPNGTYFGVQEQTSNILPSACGHESDVGKAIRRNQGALLENPGLLSNTAGFSVSSSQPNRAQFHLSLFLGVT
jgi:hypothetical protein